MTASGTQNVGLLPFPDGELFLSGQHQPLGTRSLQWRTAGWHRCYSNSGCGRWPWFSSPWSPRTTSWLLPHAAVAGGGTRFGLSPVSTAQAALEMIGRHRWPGLLSSYLGKAGGRGLRKGSDSYECPGGQCVQVWTQEHLTPGAQCCSIRTLPAWPWASVSIEETIRSYWAVGLAPYPVAHRLVTSHHALPPCHLL